MKTNYAQYQQAQQAAQASTRSISVSDAIGLLPYLSAEQLQAIYDVLKPLLKERYIERLAKLEEDL